MRPPSRIVGPIVRLQVQTGQLKVGDAGAKRYHPERILPVERLRVSRDGVVGLADGREILDAHHRQHPLRKNDDGAHGISVGFTAHYAAMQARFGGHLALGTAGENLIVETPARVEPEAAAAGFVVLDSRGRIKGHLDHVVVAHPCKPFTGFALGDRPVAPEMFKESLQFLDGGLRGFYCTWASADGELIELGDLLAFAGPTR